ncbi:hypothetical protein JCM10449v2_003590 [Rhodotorula kratochvilovae]
MATSEAQPYLVCGEKTATRCSSCTKAGIDLFFCSEEHQKLVWKMHCEVCGPGKARPFVPPDLSAAELSLVRAASYREVSVDDFRRGPLQLSATIASKAARKGQVTLARVFCAMGNIPECEYVKRAIQTCLIASKVPPDAQAPVHVWLTGLRVYTIFFLSPMPTVRDFEISTPAMVAAHLEWLIKGFLANPLPLVIASGLRHRLASLAMLLKLKLAAPSPPGFDAKFITSCMHNLLDYLKPHFIFSATMPVTQLMSVLTQALAPVHRLVLAAVFGLNGQLAGFLCKSMD